ncbi:MAG TPA: hypothetical protein VJN02_05830 [Gammaproteobacteria bacterium]|nr:hypothetical protein [Gammaproteobacteria bacterium]
MAERLLFAQANGILMIKTESCEIKPLITCREHIPALAELWYQEISRHWAPNASIEKAKQKFIEYLNSAKL